ncbi:hypothetical protein VKT23_018643 [Stygiomarasmius scandens]|uniref:Uncharacterized protein n=1 Tax=Marasmiellus scandens TaxID=2682957 RepID=A0ABR1IQA5_9AGAR
MAFNRDFPAEVVEKIVFSLWTSRLSSAERVAVMITCPLLNRSWKARFVLAASTFIYIPQLSYLLYLADIIRTEKSTIYRKWDLQHRARTITCFLNATEKGSPCRSWDEKTLEMYHIFTFMGNYVGLRTCFPSVQRLHLESQLYPALWIPDLNQPDHHGPFALVWTRIAIVFDEESRKGPYSDPNEMIPSTLSSYKVQFDIETVLSESFPSALETRYSDILEHGMCHLMNLLVATITAGLCPNPWSGRLAPIRRLDHDSDISEKLFQSRRKLFSGVGFSFQCDTILKEIWESEDIMGVKIRLWRAGRKNVLGVGSIYMEAWQWLCGRRVTPTDWKDTLSWSSITYDPPSQ